MLHDKILGILLVVLLASSALSASDIGAEVASNDEQTTDNEAINLKYGTKEYQVVYNITNGKIQYLQLDHEAKALAIFLKNGNTENGKLSIVFPREMLDAKDGIKDINFVVLADEKEVTSQEASTTTLTRGLLFTFPASTKVIKIIGTYVTTYSAQDNNDLSALKLTDTIVTLDPPKLQVSEGNLVLFTGALETIQNKTIDGAKVWIKYTDSIGAEHFLGSSVTDVNGKFTVKWLAKIIVGFSSINVYAAFNGSDEYLKSKSQSFNIVIDKEKTKTIVAYTDKKVYEIGDYVVVSGSVNEIERSKMVGIDIISPEGRYFKTAQTSIDDRSFSWKFMLDGSYAVPGRYTLIASYWHETFKTSFILDGENNRDTIKTVLQFNAPNMSIGKGDILLFSGTLMSSDKSLGIPNVDVWIKYTDDTGKDRKLISIKTDDTGRFTGKWQSDFNASAKIRMCAMFDGMRIFENAISKEYPVTIDIESDPLVAKSDKQFYTFGEIIKITGSVTTIQDVPVLIDVFDSQYLPLHSNSVEISPDGRFKYEFRVDGSLAIFGTYNIKLTYGENSEVLQFHITQPLSGITSIEDATFVDAINMPVNELRQDKRVFLKSVIKNNVNMDQSFLYIMQIQNSSNITVLIESSQHVVQKGEKNIVATPWVPESIGTFDVNIFVLQNAENPFPLSVKPLSMQITVY